MHSKNQTAAGDATPGPDCPDPAASAVATWKAIEVALRPILGHRGVEALYWRSLQLSSASRPWLAERDHTVEEAIDLDALAATLARQPVEDAEAGSRALLDQFRQLMVSLVGASLTARLLISVTAMNANTPNSQDTPP